MKVLVTIVSALSICSPVLADARYEAPHMRCDLVKVNETAEVERASFEVFKYKAGADQLRTENLTFKVERQDSLIDATICYNDSLVKNPLLLPPSYFTKCVTATSKVGVEASRIVHTFDEKARVSFYVECEQAKK